MRYLLIIPALMFISTASSAQMNPTEMKLLITGVAAARNCHFISYDEELTVLNVIINQQFSSSHLLTSKDEQSITDAVVMGVALGTQPHFCKTFTAATLALIRKIAADNGSP